jgi:hypothetical protein
MPEGMLSATAKSHNGATAAKTSAKDAHPSPQQDSVSANSGLPFFLNMQRTYGNQATQQLLRAYLANSAPLPPPSAFERQPIHGFIQRMPIPHNRANSALDNFVKTLDVIVQKLQPGMMWTPSRMRDTNFYGRIRP